MSDGDRAEPRLADERPAVGGRRRGAAPVQRQSIRQRVAGHTGPPVQRQRRLREPVQHDGQW